MHFFNIDSAFMVLKDGEPIIVVYDENRENEGDLVAVTEWMYDNTINFMAKEARGLRCAPVSKDIAQLLDWVQMVYDNSDIFGTQFTVSIYHVDTTTGISA
ncbi:3,4-dihydroxy-2-butanone-4-phosphate synthase, partial [Staphylococcus aureus]|uniref:3,4-dihydroxy-2-butanone-4-phosphate synthase n=1 Tax=Staphylococcus aureus TaxID=1280 RepID=UPI00210DC3FE